MFVKSRLTRLKASTVSAVNNVALLTRTRKVKYHFTG